MEIHNRTLTAIEAKSPYIDYLSLSHNVCSYLEERKKTFELRRRVIARFDKVMSELTSMNIRRIKGMQINEAFSKGSNVIDKADYIFLKELNNIRRSDFLILLFDDPALR